MINGGDGALFHVLVTISIIFFRGESIHIPGPLFKFFFKFSAIELFLVAFLHVLSACLETLANVWLVLA